MREAVVKGKDMGPRFAGTTDLVRVFNRALELLNSTTPESDQELLELVKKSKREMEKESSVPPTKKSRRGPSEVGDFQALGHRPNIATLTGDHGSGQSGSGSEGTPTQSTSGTSANVAHAQVRPIQMIRNPGRGGGRGEKHKRKINR
ncbi:hypothetical protein KC19_2G080700 [Ceratodon purpureus]|uniref:Uncharacterized protein n=1 Tax=Ceratodon purpureus TaxID=3225 RepID=A0A8T0IVA6_CERPU|nr:hypothetical protein KC19_2G080700 [Ceratodon purpureus]